MSRIKRWINMHGKEFNPDGSLKYQAREQMLSRGMSNAAIDDYARRLKIKYDKWKHLDETDPKPWPVYTAYDFFTAEEKQQFNPDGSVRREYVESALRSGISQGWLEEMERRKKLEVDNYNAVSARYAEQGINFGSEQMQLILAASTTYVQRRKEMEVDMRNCEPADSLPFDKDTPY
ncbi:hypothetical protein QUB80_34075 [Chlorogloeopsis sp. ULAP01]|uniref:hypothetical protein n=1 Tax=Chlorogloeopsis sp. ULAP01 TaxID=3056483 RepID=UPI0025AB2CF2|nr:hypothetical protein [Chlorogloeopsis sp. ULAP01]MDM9385685.1 hypothetical protein [Chlorogloeopsis sp. ULAP01]